MRDSIAAVRTIFPGEAPLASGLEDFYDPGEGTNLRAGFVVGVDGATSVNGRARGLHTPSDEAVFHALRTVTDAVLVGAGTVRAEGYGPVRHPPAGALWRRAAGRAETAPLVVVSRRLDLEPAASCFDGGSAVVLTCRSAAPARRKTLGAVAEVVTVGDDDVDLAEGIRVLRARGLSRLLCEGGPSLLAGLLRDGLVDELCFTLSPFLVGGAPLLPAPLPDRVPLRLRSIVDGGDGALLCRWTVS